MTFLIEANKNGRDASTIRARVPDALHQARKLVDDGWSVSVTCPQGVRYCPDQFDLLQWKYAEMADIPECSVTDLWERNLKMEGLVSRVDDSYAEK